MTLYRYGLKPDKPIGKPVHRVGVSAIAEHSDLRNLMPPVLNQGDCNGCTMFSGVAVEYAMETLAGRKPTPFDPIAGYVWERQLDGTFPRDDGSSLATTVEVGERFGFVPDANPPNLADLNVVPNVQERTQALQWRLTGATQITSLEGILETLSEGIPVHIGVAVYASMEYPTTAANGLVPMPQPNEELLGYHAMVAVGHDGDKRQVSARNSWGVSWGIGGYCEFPYDFFMSSERLIAAWRWAV